MVNSFDIVLSASARSQLLAMQKTASQTATAQQHLASGKKVNTGLEDPDKFFAARGLGFTATDNARLIDGLRQNTQVIKVAQHGIDTISKLLEQSQALALDALANTADLPLNSAPLSQQILSDSPVAYWRLNDSGGTAVNLGTVGAALNAPYAGGVLLNQTQLYSNGGANSAGFSGSGQVVQVPDNAAINLSPVSQRTIELVFNANTTAGRQVLFEEGGNVNGLEIYILNGELYFNGRNGTGTVWGSYLSVPIVAGQTYHAVLQLDEPNGELRGYLDGQLVGIGADPVTVPLVAHSGDIGIGAMRGDAWFHDGVQIGDGLSFNGRISDVAIYNQLLSEAKIEERALSVISDTAENVSEAISRIIEQIDMVARDSRYRDVNLLLSDLMTTRFNSSNTSTIVTRGRDMTSEGLGLESLDTASISGLQQAVASIEAALLTIREFSQSIGTDVSVIQTRDSMIEQMINLAREGAGKLTLADMNEEGANIKALEVASQVQTSVLALSTRSRIADLLRDLSLQRR